MNTPTIAELRETSFDEVLDPQLAFRDLMAAFAEPARWTPLRIPELRACPAPLLPEAFFILRTLADGLVHLWISPGLGPVVADSLRWNTGAALGAPREADYALVVPGDCPPLSEFRQGTEEFPERSTLVLVQIPDLPEEETVTARGPGIRDEATLNWAPSVGALVAQARSLASFPLGIDLLLVRTGWVCALPRTLEVTWRT